MLSALAFFSGEVCLIQILSSPSFLSSRSILCSSSSPLDAYFPISLSRFAPTLTITGCLTEPICMRTDGCGYGWGDGTYFGLFAGSYGHFGLLRRRNVQHGRDPYFDLPFVQAKEDALLLEPTGCLDRNTSPLCRRAITLLRSSPKFPNVCSHGYRLVGYGYGAICCDVLASASGRVRLKED